MKTIYYTHFLSIASTLIAGVVTAQPANNSIIPFKEIHRKQLTDNFTAIVIKKKELQITPSQIVFLNTVGNLPIRKDNYTEKKKVSPK